MGSYALGQPSTGILVVEVVDANGRPIPDALVDLLGTGTEISEIKTDDRGKVAFQVNPGFYEIVVTYESLVVSKKVSPDDIGKGITTFIQFPISIPEPIFRPVDALIFGVAGSMIAAGAYWKIKPLEMTGEIALGAAIFGFIFRLRYI